MDSEFAEYLSEAIENSGIRPMSAVAQRLGVSQGQLSKWLNGKDVPKDDKAATIAEFIGVPKLMIVALLHNARIDSAVVSSEQALDQGTAAALGITLDELTATDPSTIVHLLEQRMVDLGRTLEEVIEQYRSDPMALSEVASQSELLDQVVTALHRARSRLQAQQGAD